MVDRDPGPCRPGVEADSQVSVLVEVVRREKYMRRVRRTVHFGGGELSFALLAQLAVLRTQLVPGLSEQSLTLAATGVPSAESLLKPLNGGGWASETMSETQ